MATTLAERMKTLSGSPTSALIAKVAELKQQGKDIISFNVGEPDFGTPDYIKVAGIKAIAENFTKYTPGNGILELRQAIVKKLKEDNNIEYTIGERHDGPAHLDESVASRGIVHIAHLRIRRTQQSGKLLPVGGSLIEHQQELGVCEHHPRRIG